MLVSAAFVLNGHGFEAIKSVSSTLKMPSVGNGTFYRNVRKWIYPSINRKFSAMQVRVLTHVKQLVGKLTISGDGQFDSPGHCAKYCSYTIIENTTGYVIDFHVVEKG